MEILVNKNITNNYFLLLKNLSSYYHPELLFQTNGTVFSILDSVQLPGWIRLVEMERIKTYSL